MRGPRGNLNLERTMERVQNALAPWIHHGGGGFNRFAHSAGPTCIVVWPHGGLVVWFSHPRRDAGAPKTAVVFSIRNLEGLGAFLAVPISAQNDFQTHSDFAISGPQNNNFLAGVSGGTIRNELSAHPYSWLTLFSSELLALFWGLVGVFRGPVPYASPRSR